MLSRKLLAPTIVSGGGGGGGAKLVNFGAGTESPGSLKKDMTVPNFLPGDEVLVFAVEDGFFSTAPSGWTSVSVINNGAQSLLMWSGTESTLIDFGTDRGSLGWLHLRGYSLANMRFVSQMIPNETDYVWSELTGVTQGSLVLALGATDDRDILTFGGTPAGFTNLVVSAGENGANNTASLHIWGQENSAGGNITPAQTYSGSNRANHSLTVEVPVA